MTIYSYIDTLLDKWNQWNDLFLTKKLTAEISSINEILGSLGSDNPSRAKEMFRIGLLKEGLSTGKAAWNQLRNNNNIQTDLGYLADIIYRAYKQDPNNVRLKEAFSALCGIFSVLQVQEVGSVDISINTLAFKLLDIFPAPQGYDKMIWLRYLLSATFCEIKSGNTSQIEKLIKGEVNSLTIRILEAPVDDNPPVVRANIQSVEDVKKAINQRISLTGIIFQKGALFIIGEGRDGSPRGFYGIAFNSFFNFLRECYLLEIADIDSSPFTPLYSETSGSSKANALMVLKRISSDNTNYKVQFNKLMKNIEQGAREALKVLNPSSNTTNSENVVQKIYFGASGTGKSHYIKSYTADSDNKITTTFHPDTDYASFVGCYKPHVSDDGKTIIYKFIPQAFAKAYVTAWKLLLTPTHSSINSTELEKAYENWLPYNGVTSIYNYITEFKRYCDNNIFEIIDVNVIQKKIDDINPETTDKRVGAWLRKYKLFLQNLGSAFYLIIEEINRGNCAQIFGDIFQLLDRRADGFSEYVIDIDSDFATYIESELEGVDGYLDKIAELAKINTVVDYSKIALPCNLSILATMNTSDQSLFPMDSAFKRRWDWEYIPIDPMKDEVKNVKIDIDGTHYSWSKFLENVNKSIYEVNTSEDKQLGQFFATKGEDITFEQFRSKVMFYLWFEIYKDEDAKSIFKVYKEGSSNEMEPFTFGDLFKADGVDKLNKFMVDSMKLDVLNKNPEEEIEQQAEAVE